MHGQGNGSGSAKMVVLGRGGKGDHAGLEDCHAKASRAAHSKVRTGRLFLLFSTRPITCPGTWYLLVISEAAVYID